jgi:hypothetical protein
MQLGVLLKELRHVEAVKAFNDVIATNQIMVLFIVN